MSLPRPTLALSTPKRRRGIAAMAVTVLVAALSTVLVAPPAEAAPIRAFERVYQAQINGQIALVGNTMLSCPTSVAACANARAGTGSSLNDNDFAMNYVDVDSNAATFDSSAATLTLPNQAEVQFAALVWMGRAIDADGSAGLGSRNSMKLQVPGSSSYTTVTSSRTDSNTTGDTTDTVYSSYADVTSLVRTAGAGSYVGADVAAGVGSDRYAGWSLVVAYRQSALPLRDLTIFNGFEQINSSNSSDTFTLNGFRAPPNGEVRARIGVVAADGDLGLTGDSLKVNGTSLASDISAANNFFNSTNDTLGTSVTARNPAYRNNLGWDVKDIAAPGTIPNSATSATVSLTTGGEAYFPNVLTTSIDLYAPNFNSQTKTVTDLSGNSPTAAGDTLQYTITHTNTGGDPATGVVLRDPLPANLTYVPGSLRVTDGANAGAKTDAADADQGEYVAADRLVRVRLGAGANGTAGGTLSPSSANATAATSTVTFRATVDRAASGTTIDNTALLDYTAQTLGNRYVFTGNTVSTPIGTLADLALTGTTADTVAGANATYTFTVRNTGPNAAQSTAVTATLPAGVTPTSATTSTGATCTISGQTITCPLGSVAVGATPTVTVVGAVDSGSNATSLSVTGQVSAATADPDASNNTAVLSNGVGTNGDLAIVFASAPNDFVPGTERSYTATVTNNGPSDAANVSVTTTLPNGLSFVPANNPACTSSNGVGVCTIGTLPSGRSVSFTISGKLASGYTDPTVAVTAAVSGSTLDAVAANNSATATSTVATPRADVQITGTATPTTAAAGSTQQFGYTVRDNGPSDAANTVVTVPIPDGTTFVSVTSRTGSCSYDAGPPRVATCRLGTLPADGTSAVLLTVRVDPSTTATLVSTASVTATGNTPGANDSARVTAPVTVRSDVVARLTGDNPSLSGGQTETYTLGAENLGPASAHDVTFTQTLPAGFIVTASDLTVPGGTTCLVTGTTTRTVTCTTSRIDPGDVARVTVRAKAPGTLPASVVSTATVALATPSDDPDHDNDTATYEFTGANSADVSVTLDASPDPVLAGGTLTHTATVRNNGPATAENVVFTDQLPASLGADSTAVASNNVTCTVVDRLVTCPLGDLPAGGTPVTITITSSVASGTTAAIVNSATVTSGTADPTRSNDNATERTDIATRADIAVVQTVPATATAGQSLGWDVAVTNTGPSDAASVRVKEPLPAGFTVADFTQNGVTCTSPGGVLTCVFGTVASGATRNITVTAAIDATAPAGSVPLATTATTTTPQSDTTNDADADTVTIGRSADVGITGDLDPSPVVAGRPATATFTVTNRGPSVAGGTTVAIPLPNGLTAADIVAVTPSAGTCDAVQPGDTSITCRLGSVVPGSPVTVAVTLDVPSAAVGTFAVQATVSSADDTTAGNNSATASGPVTADADLAVQIIPSQDQVVAGSGFVYSFVVSNAGPSDAANVTLSGTLPAGVTPLRIDAPPGVTCRPTSQDGRSLRCDVATLAAGASLTGALTVTTSPSLDAGTSLVNTATVSSDPPDARRANNAATVTTSVTTAAQLGVRMAAVPGGVVVPGEPYSYRLTVTNSGPSDARNVRVVDTLPPGVTADRASTPQGDCTVTAGPDANSIISCELGTLGSGAIVVNLYGVTLDAGSDAASVTNNAVITSDTAGTAGGTTPQRLTSSITTPVQPVSDLVMKKTASADALVAGSPVRYTLAVTNPTGPSVAATATITDTVPAAVGNLTVTPPAGTICAPVTPDPSGTFVTCTTGAIPVGGGVSVTIDGTLLSSAAAGSVVNTATVTSASDPKVVNDSDSATITVTRSADLSVQITPAATTATPGTPTSYEVLVSNGGRSDATEPSVIIPVPGALSDVTITRTDGTAADCTLTAGGYRCAPTDPGTTSLGAGNGVTYVVRATIDAAATGTLDESASVSSPTTDDPDNGNNQRTKSVTLVPQANLVGTKSVDPTTLVPGNAATYTVKVRNDGPSVAHSVVVADTLQTGQQPGTATVTDAVGSCTTTGQDVSCTIPALAPGTTATVTIPVTVAASFSAATFSNTAVISSPDESDPAGNTPSVSGPTAPKADLDVSVTARPQDVGQDDDAAVPGTRVSYDIAVKNDGPSDATNVRLADTLPAGAKVVSAAGTGWDCGTLTAVPLTCTRTSLANGASAPVLTVVVALPAGASGTAASTVSVSSAVADPVASDNSDRVALALEAFSDLVTDKTVTPAVPVAGGTATYVVTTRNDGPSDAPGVVLTDALQVGQTATTVALTGADGTCTIDDDAADGRGGIVRCVLADPLPDGATVTMRIGVRFAADYVAGSFTNTAAATSPARGQTPGSGIDAVSGQIARQADLTVTKSGPAQATPGGSITWQIDVANGGPSDATNVVVLDALPTGVTATSATADAAGTSCSLAATVTCILPTIAANSTAHVTLVGTIASGETGTLVNRATAVAGNSVDPNDADNTSAPVETTLVSAAGLTVTKTATPGTLVAGGTARYDIVVASTGKSDATDVVVTDPMPAGVTATAATVGGGACTVGATVRCTIGTLAAGRSVTVRIDVRVAARAAGAITNRANATSPDSPADGTGQVTSPVRPLAFLAITKTADRTRAVVGSQVRYTVTVKNTGTASAAGVVVDDKLPRGLRLVSVLADRGRYDAATGEWRVGTLAVGAVATLRMTTLITSAGRIVNIAAVDPDTPGVTGDSRPAPAPAPVQGVDAASDGATPPATASSPAPASAGEAPADTGAQVGQALTVAALLLSVGLGLVLIARRRREEG